MFHVAFLQKDEPVVFVGVKVENLFRPFLLDTSHFRLQFQFFLRGETDGGDLALILVQGDVQEIVQFEDTRFQLEGTAGDLHHFQPMAIANLAGVEHEEQRQEFPVLLQVRFEIEVRGPDAFLQLRG